MNKISEYSFVPRPNELSEIRNAFVHNNKLVYILGSAGTGKTSLLSQFIDDNRNMFPGGIYGGNVQNIDGFSEINKVLTSLPSKPALIVADDVEYMNTAARNDLFQTINNTHNLNLLAAGRDYNFPQINRTLGKQINLNSINIGGLSRLEFEELIKRRISHIKGINSDQLYDVTSIC